MLQIIEALATLGLTGFLGYWFGVKFASVHPIPTVGLAVFLILNLILKNGFNFKALLKKEGARLIIYLVAFVAIAIGYAHRALSSATFITIIVGLFVLIVAFVVARLMYTHRKR